MGKEDRKEPRYRVHLAVRFVRAREFVSEYAENLSRGGLFVSGAHDLGAREEVDLEVDLPGAGVFKVKAEVAHVIDEGTAHAMGRSPGAGLAITEAPDGFEDALSSYLVRLGRRADVMLLVDNDANGLLLAAAGFQVRSVDRPEDLAPAIARAPVQVLALVVDPSRLEAYRAAAVGACDLVLTMATAEEFDALLARLDDEL